MSNIKLKDLLPEGYNPSHWSQMTPQMRADFLAKKDKSAANRKDWLSSKIKNPETGNMISVKSALRYKHDSPVYIAAIKASEKFGKASMRYDDYFDKKGNPKQTSAPVKGTPVFGGNDKPKEEPKKQGFLSKLANMFGHKDDTPAIKLDPKNPINNKSVFDTKRGSSVKIGTALKNPEKYKHVMPDIQKMIDKDPNGEKFAAGIAKAKRLDAKRKADHDRIAKTASVKGGEKPNNDKPYDPSKDAVDKLTNPYASFGKNMDLINKANKPYDPSADAMAKLTNPMTAFAKDKDDDDGMSLSKLSRMARNRDDDDDFSFGGGSSGGAGASGDW